MSSSALTELTQRLREFAAERDWDQFHSPKNLVMALSVEVAELMEHFQWVTEQQSADPDVETKIKIEEEIADIQLYLIRLADKLDIDILSAVNRKFKKNEEKYPADKVRGSSRKYTDYQEDGK